MKKNISFAQVLKKKGRLPQVEVQHSLRLVEMVQQWESYPDQDYTLRLGGVGFSHRSNQSNIPIFSSKNTGKEQEEMFDSWIERQSFITNNKENIGVQPKKIKEVALQGPVKITLTAKGRDPSRGQTPRTMTEMMRQNQVQCEQDSQMRESNRSNPYFHSKPQLPPSRGNVYEKESKMEGIRSPKTYKPQEEELNLEIEEVMMKAPKEEERIRPNQTFSKDFAVISEETNQPTTENDGYSQKATKLEQIISSTENIHEQIAELAHKYYRESHPQTEEDEELLIDQSIQRAPIQQIKKEPLFEDQYSGKNTNQDDQKRRLQDAKNMLNGYIKNLSKVKFNPITNHQTGNTPKTNANTNYRKPETTAVPSYLDVGYSFASNMIDDPHKDESVEVEVKNKLDTQEPRVQRLEQSEDLNFRNKYINVDATALVSDEHIQNIESIGYEHENARNSFAEQAKAGDNVPNHSFEVKLINSNGRKNQIQQYDNLYPADQDKIESKPQLFVSIPHNYEFSDNSYRNGLTKRQDPKEKFTYVTSKDREGESEPLFTKKQVSGNYNFGECRDRLTIKMSPKTITQITSNQKKNNEATNNHEYISKPFELNIEQPKVEEKLPAVPTALPFLKTEIAKVKQVEPKKIQKQSFSITFQQKQPESFPSPPTEPKQQPVAQIQSPSYFSTYAKNNYGQSTFKYNPPTTTYLPTSTHSTYTTCTPSYSNYGTYEPSKITFISPKTYDKSDNAQNATYSAFVSNFQPLKAQNTAITTKLEITSPKLYEQKYNIPTAYDTKTDKPEKKNFLSQLAIKESINVEEEKPKRHIPLISKGLKSSITKIDTQTPALRQSIRQSIKESTVLQNSDEFQFEF